MDSYGNDYRWIVAKTMKFSSKEEKIPLAQAFGWGESLGDFRIEINQKEVKNE